MYIEISLETRKMEIKLKIEYKHTQFRRVNNLPEHIKIEYKHTQ